MPKIELRVDSLWKITPSLHHAGENDDVSHKYNHIRIWVKPCSLILVIEAIHVPVLS